MLSNALALKLQLRVNNIQTYRLIGCPLQLCLFFLPFFLHALPLRFKVLSSTCTGSEAGSILCTSSPTITHPLRIIPGSAPLAVTWCTIM